MYMQHIFSVLLLAVSSCLSYELINNEIVERIDLDNTQALQDLTTSGKAQPKLSHHVERKIPQIEDLSNMVQHDMSSRDQQNGGLLNQQQSTIYATIQSLPQLIYKGKETKPNGENEDRTKLQSVTILKEVQKDSLDVKNDKYEDPSEDKSKSVKTKLYNHLKQSLPKLYSILNIELNKNKNVQDNMEVSPIVKTNEEEMVMKDNIVKRILRNDQHIMETEELEPLKATESIRFVQGIKMPYYNVEENVKEEVDEKETEDNYPYISYNDKKEYRKQKYGIQKTVKTHKIGDEKKNYYPKEEIKTNVPTKSNSDLETDNTIWIGYGLGVPAYKYPYNYGSSLYNGYYSYGGRPYSGWTRGYTGYNNGYNGVSVYDRIGQGSFNNYGTGFGPYGGYL